MKHIVYIGIGSNLEKKRDNCLKAVSLISQLKENKLISRSSFYTAQPWGKSDQDWFLNSVIKIKTSLLPPDLLSTLQEIEKKVGRKKTVKWGPRMIDLDILFFNEEVIETPDLIIPHPFLHQRKFVLMPLNEISPDLVHPVLKKSIRELLEGIQDENIVEKEGKL